MRPKFASGDKVFAKVRGYPPWPARVEGLADETPNKMRYHIYFYGTGETAVVKAEDICSFVENKVRLGKPKKHKNFTEALNQIEDELSPDELETLAKLEEESKSQTGVSNDSFGEDSAKRVSTAGKVKSSLSPTPKAKPKDKKRKLDNDSGSEDPDQKKRLSTMSIPDLESASKSAEVMSRAGRKIKPKRFADFDDENSEEQPMKPINKVPPLKKSDKDEDSALKDCLIAFVNGQKIKIPLSLNKPTFISGSDEEEWIQKVINYGNVLKKRLEAGETLPVPVETQMDNWTREQARLLQEKLNVPRTQEEINRSDHLKTEAALLELDLNIRSALNIKNADTERCIALLDKLKELRLTALMLKKHPDVVTTIKKVRRYIGNVPRAMTEDEEHKFHKDAEIIRNKAEHIYSKFQNMFFVPSNRSFWDVFEEERERFDQDTKHLNSEEIVSMVEEP